MFHSVDVSIMMILLYKIICILKYSIPTKIPTHSLVAKKSTYATYVPPGGQMSLQFKWFHQVDKLLITEKTQDSIALVRCATDNVSFSYYHS